MTKGNHRGQLESRRQAVAKGDDPVETDLVKVGRFQLKHMSNRLAGALRSVTHVQHDLDAAPAYLVRDGLELGRCTIGTAEARLNEGFAVLDEEFPSTLIGAGGNLH